MMGRFKLKQTKVNLAKDAPPRELAVVQQEYVNECAQLGSCQFTIEDLQSQLKVSNLELGRMRNLVEKSEEDQQAIANLFKDAGSLYYQIEVLKDEAKGLRTKIGNLNNEAYQRNRLDGVKNEQA